MSVINEMLRDLEQRKAPDREKLAVPGVSNIVETEASGAQRARRFVAMTLVFVLVLLGIYLVGVNDLYHGEPGADMSVLAGSGSEEVLATEPTDGAGNTAATEGAIDAEPAVGAEANAKTNVVSSNPEEPQSGAMASLNSETLTQADAGNGRRQGEPLTSVDSAGSGSTNSQNATAQDSVVVMRSDENSAARSTETDLTVRNKATHTEGNQPLPGEDSETLNAESLAIANRAVVTPVVSDSPVRSLSASAIDRQTAEQASRWFAQGRDKDAYRLLYDLIAKETEDHRSRAVLAGQLLAEQRLAEAGDILVMADVASFPDLRQIKARWYMQKGDSELALHTLRETLPPLASYPDYYALLASYYQQQGYMEQAAKVYRQLLEFDPGVSQWWAGLGVSLDRSKNYTEAARAYRQALQLPGLPPALIQFSRQRLQVLEG